MSWVLAITMTLSLVGINKNVLASEAEIDPFIKVYTNDSTVSGSSAAKDGIFSINDNKLTFGATGGKTQTGNDNLYFAYIPVSGDFTITSKISNLSGADKNSIAALMVRNGVSSTSPHLMTGINKLTSTGFAETRLPARSNSAIAGVSTSSYFSIARSGINYTISYSADGITYNKTKSYSDSDNMGQAGSTLNVGVATCAVSSIFEELKIVDGQGKIIYDLSSKDVPIKQPAPIVNITSGDTYNEGEPYVLSINSDQAGIVNVKVNTTTQSGINVSLNQNDTNKKYEGSCNLNLTTDPSQIDVSVTNSDGNIGMASKSVSRISKAPVIVSIKSIDGIQVEQGKSVILPDKVTAVYSDNTEKQVAVTWDKVDTSTVGVKTINGKVEGTDVKATIVITVNEKALEMAGTDINATAGQNGSFTYDVTSNTFNVSSSYGNFNVLDINTPSAMYFPNVSIDTDKYNNFLISADVKYVGSVTSADKGNKYAGLMIRKNLENGVVVPYFATALRPNGSEKVNGYCASLGVSKEFQFSTLSDSASKNATSMPNNTFTLRLQKLGNKYTAYIIDKSGSIYTQPPVEIEMSGKLNVGLFTGLQAATFKNVKIQELDAAGQITGKDIYNPEKAVIPVPTDDLTPAEVSIKCNDTYAKGGSYTIETISNEAGNVDIEVNGAVMNTGILVQDGSLYKYSYTIPSTSDDTLTIFVTVKDKSNNKSIVYAYAKANGSVVPVPTGDLAPPEVSIKCNDTYVKGESYTIETISNEVGNVTIEVNGKIINTSSLLKDGSAYKYLYTIPSVNEDNLTIFVTVKDDSNNTATAYAYSKVKGGNEEPQYKGKTIFVLDQNGKELTKLTGNSTVLIKGQIENTEGKLSNYTLIGALYNSDNRIISVVSTNKQIEANKSAEITASIVIPGEISGYKLKVFLWDALEGTVAYTDEKVIN
jgi:hypothetical protein